MIKRKIIFLSLAILSLASCNGTTSSITSTGSSSSSNLSSNSSSEVPNYEESWTNKISKLNTNLHLEGTISYQFYDSETLEPKPSDPSVSNINLYYTDTAFEITYEGAFDDDSVETLFKSDNNTVELRFIDMQNNLVIACPTDDDGNEYDFTPYVNPFKTLTTSNLAITDEESAEVLNSSLQQQAFINSLAFTFTTYNFTEIEHIKFFADNEKITGLEIKTPVLHEPVRTGVYTFTLNIVETGDDVVGPVTPEPLQANENQQLLKNAVNVLQEKDYFMKIDIPDMGYGYDLYKTNDCIYISDPTDPNFTFGFVKGEDGKVYELGYDRTNSTVGKYPEALTDEEGNPISMESLLPQWNSISEVYFNYMEETKTFVLDEKGKNYAGLYAYVIGCQADTMLYTGESVTFYLDDSNNVDKVEVTGSMIFEPITLSIEQIDNITLPIDITTLPTI